MTLGWQERRRSRGPSRLVLCAIYFSSFFCTSLWLAWQHDDGRSSARRRPWRGRPRRGQFSLLDFGLGGGNDKRPRPAIFPSDFHGLKLLAYGDEPYQFGPWDGAPIVVASHKLLFWTTPKVACTEFKKLFRRMQGYQDWMVENSKVPHRPDTNGLNYLYHFRPAEADVMLTDRTWTRAIFVRDPKERLLSAYLDKVASNYSSYVRRHCCSNSKMEALLHCGPFGTAQHSVRELERLPFPAVSFSLFLQQVYGNCSDPHWKPQAQRMPRKYWPYINFVGHLHDDQIQQDVKRLLQKIEAWDEYGAFGWPNGTTGSMFSVNHRPTHATFAKKQFKAYYTLELEDFVERIHEEDYDHPLFNLSVIRWSDPVQ